MKSTRALVYSLFTAALIAGVQVAAQTINNGIISYTYVTTQQSAGAPVGASATPYSFQAFIEGSGITNSNLPASVTLPDTTNIPLVFNSGNGGRMVFQSASYSDVGALQTAFPNSDINSGPHYTLSANSQSPSLDLADVTQSHMLLPTVTLTGGSWNVGTGQYDFNPTNPLGISFNAISDLGTGDTDQYHFDYSFNGTNADGSGGQGFLGGGGQITAVNDVQSFYNFQFEPGTYTLEVGYDDLFSLDPNGFGSGQIAAGLYEVRSTISLNAIPEPSTYAAILGAVALAGVVVHRRRRQLA
jgi:hypothetical protein